MSIMLGGFYFGVKRLSTCKKTRKIILNLFSYLLSVLFQTRLVVIAAVVLLNYTVLITSFALINLPK